MPRLMLIDSNSLIYRAYFALIKTPLTTSKGQLVNAVFGFWSIVLRGFQDVQAGLRDRLPSTCPRPPSATTSTPSTRQPGGRCRTT